MSEQTLRRRSAGGRRGAAGKRERIAVRPLCEALEARRLLATQVWISTGVPDDNWTTAGNWSQGPINPSDTLDFNGSDTSPTSNNNESSVNPYFLQFDQGGYDLTGNGINLADSGGSAILADNPGGTNGNNAITLPLSLVGNATVNVANAGASLTFNGTLSESSPFTLTNDGAGTLILSASSNASDFAGTVDDQGTLQVDSASGPGSVQLDGGTLLGTGTVGTVTTTAAGGTLSPGDPPAGTGTLTAGSVTLNSSSTFAATLDGPGAGQYSQLSASGTVDLAGATLSINLGYAPGSTDSYVLIQNTSNAPVQGTFQNLPQGGTITVGNTQFVINYDGGPSGNEVILSVSAPPVANPDLYTLPENDQNFSVPAPGILGNDTNPSGLNTLHPILVTSPVHGTLTLNDDGSFGYVPATGFSGTDSFTYEVTNGLNTSQPATVSLVVNPVNSPPQAASITYNVVENNPLAVGAPGLLSGSVSPEGLPLTPLLVSGPTHGTLASSTLPSDGSFTYTPAAGYTGTDSFTYILQDSNGLTSAPATVTLDVQDVPSTVLSSSQTVAENGILTVPAPGVLTGAVNPAKTTLSAILLNGPADGVVALNADGSYTYTPAAGFSGTDSFTFKANDGTLDSNTATVTLHVTPAAVAPTAADQSYSLAENQVLAIGQPGLFLGSQNPSGGTLTAMVVNQPTHGSVTVNADGSFTYTPAQYFFGTDTFTYYLQSNSLNGNVATVTINVAAVPQIPVANNDTYTTSEDTPLTITAPGVLANDTDPNGAQLTAVVATLPSHGSLILNADGSFTYTPVPGFFGQDSFTYNASNGTNPSKTPATVTIDVNQVFVAPTAANQNYTVAENTPASPTQLNQAAPGLLVGSQNPNGGALTVVLVNQPLHGSFTKTPQDDGSFTYVPDPFFFGTDSFTYYLQSNGLNSNVATATINVSQVAQTPTAVDQSYNTKENGTLTLAAPGVLLGASDPNNAPLTAVLASNPANGSVTLNPDGSFTYTPDPGFSGSDSFTYEASNGTKLSAPATVTIAVAPVLLPPTTSGSSFTMQEDDQLNVPAPGILGSASDPQGLPLQAILVNSTLDGSLTLNPDGSFSYTPRAGFAGTDSFTFKAGDGKLDSGLSTVTIDVSGIAGTTVQVAPGVPDNVGFTNVSNPSFSGTTLPGLTVQLYSQAAGDAPTLVGQAQADSSGHYTVTSKALPDGAYNFSVDAVRSNGIPTGPVTAPSLTIDTSAPRITDVFMVPRTGQIMITFQAGPSGMNLASITNPANYSFSRAATPNPRSFLITSATLVPPGSTTGPVTVALTSSVGKPIPAGHYLFQVLSGGIADNAGNRLAGLFTGSYPTGGEPGSIFSARFFSTTQKLNAPVPAKRFIPVLTSHGDPKARPAAALHRGSTDARPAGPLGHGLSRRYRVPQDGDKGRRHS